MSIVTTSRQKHGKFQLWLKSFVETRWFWRLRIALIAAMHLTAIYILASFEYGPACEYGRTPHLGAVQFPVVDCAALASASARRCRSRLLPS